MRLEAADPADDGPRPILARARILNDGTMFTIHYWPHRAACVGSKPNHGGQDV